MESLDETSWDVVIAGTGLPQCLLALALSRSDLKILHVDSNNYYGGNEAALSLSEAEEWAQKHSASSDDAYTTFSHARVTKEESQESLGDNKLLSSRAYSLALGPQVLYARSNLLSALVSSRTNDQLDFQAVGSWFVISNQPEAGSSQPELIRVPGGREDVFQDKTFDLKAKRSLMKFLRFVVSYEEHQDVWIDDKTKPFASFLQERFSLPQDFHRPIFALTFCMDPPLNIATGDALPRVARHLTSIGVFGPGFGAVLPKWGGLAELGQVACRACAVGGGVYVLGKGVSTIEPGEGSRLSVKLSDGERITTQWIAGCPQDLPDQISARLAEAKPTICSRSISVVSSSLTRLFPTTSEGGVTPAGAVVMVPSAQDNRPPVYIVVHSGDSGECPSNQCVLYASTLQPSEPGFGAGFGALEDAITSLVESVGEPSAPRVLWSMQYEQHFRSAGLVPRGDGHTLPLPPLTFDQALDDGVLNHVKSTWQTITAADSSSFMNFEPRGDNADDNEI